METEQTGDGEEITVYNWANIQSHTQVRIGHSERTSVFVNAGDATWPPDAVTIWLAAELEQEHGVDVMDHDIDVVDPTRDEVTIL